MDIHDYVELITLALWVISVVGIGILSRVHFKNKRLEQFRNTADNLMKSYVRLYDKENLSDEQKNRLAELAIDEIVDNDLQNLYIKVTKDFKVRIM